MRTFKWLVSIIVALLLIVGVGMPFLVGIWVQKVYPKVFLGPQKAGGIQMSILNYKRGFFSSTAKIAIGFNNANTSNRIVFDQIIQHGPLVFENGPKLALALATSKSDDPKFNATARTIWKLNKQIVSNIRIPNVDIASTPIHFSLQNLDMEINYHSVSETLKANASIDKMEFQGSSPSPYTVTLNNIKTAQDLNRANHIWYGSRSGNVADLTVNAPQGPIAQIHNLSARGEITENSGKTNIQLNYQAKNCSILNNAIDSIDFAFSINGLDTNALSNLMEKAEAKKATPTSDDTRALSDSALELISKGILLKLDHLSLATKLGEAKADGQVSLPPLSSGNIFQLITALKIDFNLQVPKDSLLAALVAYHQNDKSLPANTTPAEFAQQQVDQWIQTRVLVPGANSLLMMKVQFENAKLLVNGVEQHSAPATSAPTTPAPVATPNKAE